jgi:hypothetical protein
MKSDSGRRKITRRMLRRTIATPPISSVNALKNYLRK